MYSTKSNFCILAIICTIQLAYGSSVVQDSQHIENGSLYIGKNSFDEGKLLFAVCERSIASMSVGSMKCNIVQKVYPNSQSTYSCFITIKGDHEGSRLHFPISVITLGQDKAIIYWGEDYKNSWLAKINTVDLKTCKMNQIKIPDPTKEVLLNLHYANKVVTYDDDSFDVFFNDSQICGNDLCKLQINADGTAKGGPTTSNIAGGLDFVLYISPIATRSSSKGYVYLKKDPMGYTLSLVKADGSENTLEKYVNTARPTVSAGRNVVSACTKPNVDSGVICTQYDENGNVKFATTIPEVHKNTQSRAVNNLPDGGILVLLAEWSNCDNLQNCDESKYHLAKIDGNGKYVGNASIKDFDSVTNQWKYPFVYKYDNSKYCAAIIGQDPVIDDMRLSNFEIIHDCVTEKDFVE